MEYSKMAELSHLAPEIRVQIQVRTDIHYQIQINYIGCVIRMIHAYNAIEKNCDPAIGGSLVGGIK